ncbi:MAG: hypothetical protein WBV71_13585, partial [Roseobacter sp.]
KSRFTAAPSLPLSDQNPPIPMEEVFEFSSAENNHATPAASPLPSVGLLNGMRTAMKEPLEKPMSLSSPFGKTPIASSDKVVWANPPLA